MLVNGSGPTSVARGETRDDQHGSSIDPIDNATITLAQASLITRIKAHIAQGDKAAEKANKAAEKAEQHYISAGQYLAELKANHTGTWDEWEALLKSKVGIGKSRASELMQIADGRKTVAEITANTTERSKKHRALSPLRNGENADKAAPAKPIPSQVQRELDARQAHIKELEAAREHDQDLVEKLRAAEVKIVGLESEVAELKQENAGLRAKLEAASAAPAPKKCGRPKGSKNKPKPPVAATTVNVATPGPDLGNDPGPFPEILRRGPKAVSS